MAWGQVILRTIFSHLHVLDTPQQGGKVCPLLSTPSSGTKKKDLLCGRSLPVEHDPREDTFDPHPDILSKGSENTILPGSLWTPYRAYQMVCLIVVSGILGGGLCI